MPSLQAYRLRGPVAALLALLVLAASVSAARAAFLKPESFFLENGMQVVVVTDSRAPIVTHMVWYRTGSADEPKAKSGIAHFLEHLMFKGTEKLAPGEFSKIVAQNGGQDNAFTSYDYTAYFQNVAADKLDLVMGLEADRMRNLRLTEAIVAPELKVVLEERSQRTDNNPAALLGEQMNAAQYLNHPYGIPVIGWRHEVEKLTTADAIAFYNRYYQPANAILVVVGDVSADKVRELAEKHYGVIPGGEVPPRLRPQEPPQIAARRLEYADARVREPSWQRSYLAPSYTAGESQHAHALDVLAEILGGGTSGRLYKELVVKQGIAAGAGAWYSGDSRDLGRFVVYASPNRGGNLPGIEAAVDVVLRDIVANGVNEGELSLAKNQLRSDAIYARDSLSSTARLLGASLAVGQDIDMIVNWPDEVAKVSAEQVRAAAQYVLDPRQSVTALLLPKEAS
ncbi:M16 family metallopeptidase [Oceanibacterium hippocampi]|uniref:Protease 3 n=1 Tax=Oceanibacterium hippocampi TaxID=745714 RepID=A0A1Y5S6X4_9PROT|nr:pitrilysin family protein [Oceanibacterium hippocampi]SLN32918.1 Protease 3 precursor [Oceanibacterium hippocampi]